MRPVTLTNYVPQENIYLENTESKNNWNAPEIPRIPPESCWYLFPWEIRRSAGETTDSSPSRKCVRTAAKSVRKQEASSLRFNKPAGEKGKELSWPSGGPAEASARPRGSDGRSQHRQRARPALPAGRLPWASVSASCLFPTVAFLSKLCVRREEAEGPGAEAEDGRGGSQRTEGLSRRFSRGRRQIFQNSLRESQRPRGDARSAGY